MRVMEASSSLDTRQVQIRNLEAKLQEMTGELASTHTRLRAQIMRNEERERWFQAQLSESNDTIEALGLNLKEAKILNEDSENSTWLCSRMLERILIVSLRCSHSITYKQHWIVSLKNKLRNL